MAKLVFRQHESDLAVHPGELLGEEIEVRGMTQKALADAMARPAQMVNEIIRGKKAITADTAVQLEDVLGISAQMWLGLQIQHDLVLARRAHVDRGAASSPAPRRRVTFGVAETAPAYAAKSTRKATKGVVAKPAAKK